ncbi:MAG: hypothetical protein ACTHN0_09120, partial [Aquihabitans sp.]
TTPARHLTDTAAQAGINPHRYPPPTGERRDRSGFHLIEADESDPAPPGDADEGPAPAPEVTGHRPADASHDPAAARDGAGTDPTRAGPTHA